MPIFEYVALNPEGQSVRGTLHGMSLDEAARALRGRGLNVQHMAPASMEGEPIAVNFGKPATVATGGIIDAPVSVASYDHRHTRRPAIVTGVIAPLFGRVKLSELQFLYRQLAAMFGAGVSMAECLETLSGQMRSAKARAMIEEFRGQALEGRPLSYGMQRYPEVFSPLHISLIRAGEAGGFLDKSMRDLAEYCEREIALRNIIRWQTFYPKAVLGMSIIIFGGANLIIGAVAPGSPIHIWSPLTEMSTWKWLGPLLIFLYLFVRLGLPNARIKYLWDGMLAGLPYIGRTVRQFAMAKFGRALGSLYKGGIPIHQAFKLAADSCGNEYLRAKMYPAFEKLDGGGGIHQTMLATGAFDSVVMNMVMTGEKTGNLDFMLEKMSEYYEGEAEVRAKQTGVVFGIFVYMCVAIYVFFVMLQFYGGMFGATMGAANGDGSDVKVQSNEITDKYKKQLDEAASTE